jgi:hypothetical protein
MNLSFVHSRRMTMLRKPLFLAVAVCAAALATSSKAQAWGAYHVGYTHVGPSGVHHYGYTGAYGAGRYGSVSHYGSTGYGYHYGGTRTYGGAYGGYHYGGAAYGGYHYGGYSAYGAGAYRRW